ncbi:MAG: hypothetical protein ACE5OY_07250 [Candidatus Bathyarchaeia archaeon]
MTHYFRRLPPKEFQEKMERVRNLSTLTLVDLDVVLAELAFKHMKRYAQIGVGGGIA